LTGLWMIHRNFAAEPILRLWRSRHDAWLEKMAEGFEQTADKLTRSGG
jgi:hypothetical protein